MKIEHCKGCGEYIRLSHTTLENGDRKDLIFDLNKVVYQVTKKESTIAVGILGSLLVEHECKDLVNYKWE